MTKAQRAFWLFMAGLFLVTSVAFSVLVVYQIHQEDKKKQQQSDIQKAISEAQVKQNATNVKEGKLEGTKLQDFTPVSSVAELQKIDTVVGTGAEVQPGASVSAHYTGAVAATGVIFQSSHDQPGDKPIDFSLSGVIKGWTDGVPGMKVGGKRRLLIPAALAYGANPPQGSNIPANADLVFDIEITTTK